MGVGSTIPINVGILGFNQSLSVNVAAMNSQSMTFTTNPGHLIYPGYITFSASPASPGSINFNINLGGTVANSMEFNFGGSAGCGSFAIEAKAQSFRQIDGVLSLPAARIRGDIDTPAGYLLHPR